jgi:hypothetical protein
MTRPLAVHRLLTHKRTGWRALPTTKKSGALMTYGYIKDLKFAVEVFDEGGNLQEVLVRCTTWTPQERPTPPAGRSIQPS